MRRWACYLAAAVICAGCAAPEADPPTSGSTPGAADAEGEAGATPRMPDGKPDLNGMWGGGGGGDDQAKPDANGNLTVLTKQRPCAPTQPNCAHAVNFERDSGVMQRMNPNVPVYKPEHWARVQELDENGNQFDPEFHCYPLGVPRVGPPNKIVQTATEVIFLYRSHNSFRVVPIDGRPHDPVYSQDVNWNGDSVGSWDGDTLVVDVVGFNDESWLGWPGWFHSNNMHVIERLRREGNTLHYDVRVEDPDVLLQPWDMTPRAIKVNPNPKAFLIEDPPCDEQDYKHMTSRERG
jgi:hypothetical protein